MTGQAEHTGLLRPTLRTNGLTSTLTKSSHMDKYKVKEWEVQCAHDEAMARVWVTGRRRLHKLSPLCTPLCTIALQCDFEYSLTQGWSVLI